jgi:hypothetical protein
MEKVLADQSIPALASLINNQTLSGAIEQV